MKDVTERLEGEAPTRRVFQQQLFMTLAVSTVLCSVQAAPQVPEALGSKLTPLGGEIAASASGDIPAWTQPGQQDEGWSYGQVRGEHWKFKGDKPLYSIDANNLAQHSSKLSPDRSSCSRGFPAIAWMCIRPVGPVALGLRGREHPAERWFRQARCCRPRSGRGSRSGHPVPHAEYRCRGDVEHEDALPRRWRRNSPDHFRNFSTQRGEWLRQSTDTFFFTPWGKKGSALFSSVGRLENATFFNYLEPAALAGQSAVQTAVAGEQATTFYYFPGQRRVRRMPSYSYDAPQIGLDNQYTVDEANVFFGTMDRFDWKLIGKQELLVPYNDFGAYDTGAKVETFAGNDSIAPQSRRYELHRVWVVEANVRQGMRHQAPKRMFYIDEDSWNPLLAVDYDKQGQIWKVREGFSIPVYETGACDVQAQVQYNLADGRYLFDMTSIGAGKNDIRWLTEDNGSPA